MLIYLCNSIRICFAIIVISLDATGCRGGSIYEYNRVVQDNPDKKKLIGNAMRITDSIITRVIPYEETTNQFFRRIEADL